MNLIRNTLAAVSIGLISVSVYADPLDQLTLTDKEMKKLKTFFPVENNERITWKGDPISISLPLGKEKRLLFSSRVSADLKGALTTDQMRLLNDNKSLYLTALKSFSTARLFVTLEESGEVILIDLTTSDQASVSAQAIDQPRQKSSENFYESPLNENGSYVNLIRFAWQQTYAPKRLMSHTLSYQRVAMHTPRFVSDLIYGDKVIAFPQGSWISGNHYVTAVFLRNKYPHKTQIDLRKELCGDWQAATIYPRSILQPYGHKEKDSTMLFLVSTRPFIDTLGVCHGDA